MKEKTGEEVIIRKHKKGWMIASLCGCVVVFALAVVLLVLSGAGDDPFDAFYAIAIAAVGFGGGVYFCRKIVYYSKTPRVLAVFAEGQVRAFAAGVWYAFRPREIQFVEEKPVTSKYRTYDYGALDISLRDGRILHVDLADAVAEAKERLLELKTRDTILEEQENEKSPPVWDPSSDPLPEE